MMKKFLILFSVVFFLGACAKKDPNDTLGNTLLPKKVQEDLRSYEATTDIKIFDKDKQSEGEGEEKEKLIKDQSDIYTNELFQFETLKPKGWEQQDNQLGTLVVFLEPKVEGDTFQSNINIIAQALTQEFKNLTLDEYIANSVKEITPFFDTFEVLSNESSTFGGLDSKTVVYKVSKADQTLKLIQRIVKRDNTIYVITYTSTVDEYETFIEAFKTVENTFRFKG